MKADVTVKQIEQISGGKLNYVVIETDRGRVNVSVGDKNYTKLTELLKDTAKQQTTKP